VCHLAVPQVPDLLRDFVVKGALPSADALQDAAMVPTLMLGEAVQHLREAAATAAATGGGNRGGVGNAEGGSSSSSTGGDGSSGGSGSSSPAGISSNSSNGF